MNKFTTAHVLNLNVYLHEAAKAGIFIELWFRSQIVLAGHHINSAN
jgi:hypothetical protein